jgi:hypothetical protein
VYLGCAYDGIYSLTGANDDGVSIDAVVRTGVTNFDSTQDKNVPEAFVGIRNDGTLVFKTITRDPSDGTRQEHWYQMTDTSAAIRNVQQKFARGRRAVYWQFEIVNDAGADFDIDHIELTPVLLKRKGG